MKKLIPILIAGSLAGLLIANLASGKDDASVIATVVDTLDATDLNPIDTGGGGSAVADLKTEQVLAIITDLREIERHNGILGIARKNKVSTGQVKAVVRAIKRRLQDLAPDPE